MKSISKILFALMLVSGILLLLDLENREKVQREELRIAVFKMIARPMLEDAERGIVKALTERGYLDREDCTIRYYCADGDMATANAIAQTLSAAALIW